MEQWRPKRLIICGDSFNIGIGCQDLTTQPYGTLLADHYGIPLVNLAKGSSTNLSIWLQVEYAIRELKAGPDDLILVNETSSNRFNWFPDDKPHSGQITNLDVNYHKYPPYGDFSYHQILPEHPMQNHPGYTGTMITENIAGVLDFLDNYLARGDYQIDRYYDRIARENPAKLKLMANFYASIYDENISQLQSKAFMSMSSTMIARSGAKHLMLLSNPNWYRELIADENLMYLSWGEITLEYPDNIPSGHADERGHVVAKDMIVHKLKLNGWI